MEINGKYAKATIHTQMIEKEAISQIQALCDQPFAEGSRIEIMPDVHAGKGCTIGTTMTIDPMHGKVCPNLVGVDIGCGMNVTMLGKTDIDFEELDNAIRAFIPAGRDVHEVSAPKGAELCEWVGRMRTDTDNRVLGYLNGLNTPINLSYEIQRLGTLGGGNHFIEIDRAEDGQCFLVIHSGSRHLGTEICSYFMKKANAGQTGSPEHHRQERMAMIERMKEAGRHREIPDAIKEFDSRFRPAEPSPLAYVEGDDLHQYLNDMKLAQMYASDNRNLMADIICRAMGWKMLGRWETVHNYIDMDDYILRKGAIRLDDRKIAIIPISMRDGAFIVKGKGNPEWNFSGPHGAGRVLSRSQARNTISMEQYKASMEGIWTTSVNPDTIDESPAAYRGAEDILSVIGPTAEIIAHVLPIYSFKAGN